MTKRRTRAPAAKPERKPATGSKATTKTGSAPRLTADIRRERIIAAAIDLFAANGYETTKIEEIARAAGCTTGPVYHFFGSKEQIFVAAYTEVSRDYWAHTREALKEEKPPLLKIIDICHQFYALPAKQASEFARSGLSVLGYREVYSRQKFIRQTVQKLLEEAMHSGDIQVEPSEPLANLIVGMAVEGLALVGIAPSPEEAVTRYRNAISRLILGLRAGAKP